MCLQESLINWVFNLEREHDSEHIFCDQIPALLKQNDELSDVSKSVLARTYKQLPFKLRSLQLVRDHLTSHLVYCYIKMRGRRVCSSKKPGCRPTRFSLTRKLIRLSAFKHDGRTHVSSEVSEDIPESRWVIAYLWESVGVLRIPRISPDPRDTLGIAKIRHRNNAAGPTSLAAGPSIKRASLWPANGQTFPV